MNIYSSSKYWRLWIAQTCFGGCRDKQTTYCFQQWERRMTNASGKMSELLTHTSNSAAESRVECMKEASLSLGDAHHTLWHMPFLKRQKNHRMASRPMQQAWVGGATPKDFSRALCVLCPGTFTGHDCIPKDIDFTTWTFKIKLLHPAVVAPKALKSMCVA